MGRSTNRGFSLVELIVVVLIMVALAVALAPQVMKWVNNARIANDAKLVDSICSEAMPSFTNGSVAEENGGTVTITVDLDGISTNPTGLVLEAALCSALGVSSVSDQELKAKAGSYEIEIVNGALLSRPSFDDIS